MLRITVKLAHNLSIIYEKYLIGTFLVKLLIILEEHS